MDAINDILTKITNIELNTLSRIFIAIGIFVLFLLVRPLLSYIIIKIFKVKGTNSDKIKKSAFYKPLKLFFLILGIYLAILFLNVPATILAFATKLSM